MIRSLDDSARPGDFYDLESTLTTAERAQLETLRDYLTETVAPIANDCWVREEFPHHVLTDLAKLGFGGLGLEGYGCAGGSHVLAGLAAMEMATVDASIATGFGVHNHLAMDTIHRCGSEEQKQRWLPPMASADIIGAFGLTEPLVGSGVSRGLQTTCSRVDGGWLLNGSKKWIGNGTFADVIVIWARDVDDDQVKGFLVEGTAPGFSARKMEGKIALRTVQNAELTLEDVHVTDDAHLAEANSFVDTAGVLTSSRVGVGWSAIGCARGAYIAALGYAKEREQFGQPIAGFQLVQDLLVKMLGNITSSQAMMLRLAQLADDGRVEVQHAALAKAVTTTRMRETVRLGAGAAGRQRDPARARRRAVRRGRGGDLLLRGHARDQLAHRGRRDHRPAGVRLAPLGRRLVRRSNRSDPATRQRDPAPPSRRKIQ